MTTLFHSFVFFSLFVLLSTVDARLPRTSPEDEPQKPYDLIDVPYSNSEILLPTEKSSDSGPGSAMNIEVDSRQNRKESGKFPDEVTVMPASGSFAGKKRQDKEKEIPMVVKWRPINRHLDRMRVFRRSFPVNCRHRRYQLEGGAEIRQGRSSMSEEDPDVVDGKLRRHHRRYGKIISARWIDGTTFHRLDAVTIPDVVYGEGMMLGEFRSPRFNFHRNHRHHDHRKEGIGHVIWQKFRNFLINL